MTEEADKTYVWDGEKVQAALQAKREKVAALDAKISHIAPLAKNDPGARTLEELWTKQRDALDIASSTISIRGREPDMVATSKTGSNITPCCYGRA